ncbi:MAG: hypothetical protein HY741_18340 [Chloroflexi bacterium]|nr:hypothetical protein [Chloroflexota bacterium]
MKRKYSLFLASLVLATLLAVLLFTAVSPAPVSAFDHAWANYLSTNVAAAERGLWDDAPAGVASEAGLLWFVNNQNLDETVGYKTTEVNISTNAFPILRARADITDGMDFKVGYATSATAPCKFPAALVWPNAQANGGYATKSATLPANITVKAICIWLTDNTDAINFGRTAALIDYIELRSGAGALGWWEDFAGSP